MSSQLGPFYVSQVPRLPLVITVTHDDGTPVDLTVYDSVVLLLFRPDGTESSPGELEINADNASQVVCSWPDVSVFTVPGEWTVQVQMLGPGSVNDLALPITFDVRLIGS